MSLTIEQTINQLVIQQVDGDTLEITTQGPQGPAGPSTTFTVAGNSGPSQTIGNGDTLTLTSPVSFQQVVMSATDTATFEWPDQSGRVFLASPSDGSAGTPAFRAIVFADLDAVLGTMAQQDANAVAITGGTIASAAISGGSASGLTSLGVTGNTTLGDASGDTLTINGAAVDIPNGLSFTTGRIRINSAITTARLVVEETGSTVPAGFFRSSTGAGFEAQSSATDANEGVAKLQCNNALTKGLLIRAAASQSANLQEWRDSSANALSIIAASGAGTFGIRDAGTNDTQTVLTVRRNSTSTPAASFASRLLWQLESSTTENVDAASVVVSHVVATHASRTERVQHFVNDAGGAREYIRGEASGSAPMIGFLGAAAVIRQALGAWAGLTDAQKLDALRDALTNLGLTSYT